MGKTIKLKESEIKDIVKKIISEQIMGNGTNAQPAKFDMGLNMTIGSSLFKNGIDVIDTKNFDFIKLITKLKQNPPKNRVVVTGGASAVGSTTGYDNNALAKRRSINFINALRQFGIDTKNFIIGNPIVGKATVKNSPEAEAEQFVRIQSKPKDKIESAIDNTSMVKPQKYGAIPNQSNYKTIRIPPDKYNDIVNLLRKNGYKI